MSEEFGESGIDFELESDPYESGDESGEGSGIPDNMPIVPNDWTSPFKVDTFFFADVPDVFKVGFLFYNGNVDPENWGDIRQGEIIYANKIITPEGIKFYLDNHSHTYTQHVNNLVLVNNEYELIASRHFTILIDLAQSNNIYINVNAYKTFKEVEETTFTISFVDHKTEEELHGITRVHDKIFDYSATRGQVNEGFQKVAGLGPNPTGPIPILEEVQTYDSTDTKLQFIKDVPQYFDGLAKKYSYYIWYYLDKQHIIEKVRTLIPDFELPEDIHIGFNSRIGSFLYYYKFTPEKLIFIIIGSNGYNKIDIYVANNELGLTDEKLIYRLKINKWYDRLYFALPKFSDENILGRFAYVVYPKDYKIPETWNYTMPTNTEVELPYTINLYGTSKLSTEQFLEFGDLFMAEFSDIGDILINCDLVDAETPSEDGIPVPFRDRNYFKTTLVNIFGQQTKTQESNTPYTTPLWDYKLMNTYDIDDRPSITSLPSFFETSVEHIKYLIAKNYFVYYVGSEYTVGYDKYNQNYLILFKDHPIERVRRKLADNFRFFAGSYLIFSDHIESIYGEELENNTTFFGTQVSDILCYDRGVVVVENIIESSESGESGSEVIRIGAYRK